MGMSQVKSNEILSEEIVFKLLNRILTNRSETTSFPFGVLLLPEAIIQANFPVEEESSGGWLATWLDLSKPAWRNPLRMGRER